MLFKLLLLTLLIALFQAVEVSVRYQHYPNDTLAPEYVNCTVTTSSPDKIDLEDGDQKSIKDYTYAGWGALTCTTSTSRRETITFYGHQFDTVYFFHDGFRLGFN